MNPLSTWTFYRRHKRHATLLLSLSIVVTIGLYSMVALVWGVFVEPARLAHMALSEFSMVTPPYDESGPDPAVLAQLQANPDVTNLIPTTFIRIQLPGMLGQSFQFDLLALSEAHVPFILDRLGATLKDGHLLEPGTNGLLLSQDVATMLGVEVGETYEVVSSEFYGSIDARPEPTPFDVVGVLKSDIEVGIVSLEFLNAHAQYRSFPTRFLVVAQEGREGAVDDFLRGKVQTTRTEVWTLTKLNERIMNEALPGLVLLVPPILIVAIAFAFVIVVVNQLANARRLPEFGILHATGRSRSWLIRRLTMETTTLALAGWALGIGLSYLGLYLLKVTVFAAQGHDLNYIVWLPMLFAFLAPAAIAGFTFLSVRRTFKRLDPVAIVERRELSQEGDQQRLRMASKSSPRPLAPATFYRRHRRRAVLLISGMSVMILGVVFIIFTLAVGADAQKPFMGYLSRVSIVRSPGVVQSLDPSVVDQVKAHPAVERVIPVAPRGHMLSAYIPPFTSAEASPFGVYAADMAYLVELYGLKLKEGHLPRAGSNEMVIPQVLAQNRELQVGDVIGVPDQPAYPGAPSLPVEFVVSGIFAEPPAPEDGNGWGFVSLEFLETYEPWPIPDVLSRIVVPQAGQKGALDDWLVKELAGVDASVLTQRRELSRIQNKAQQDMMGIAFLESLIAIVATIGLAVLNYIFTSQRHSEFGVLHALGYGRGQLVRRVLGETAFTTAIAWGLSAIVGLTGLLVLRFGVFAPQGLTFNLFSPTPWLYTLPIPIAVLALTGGTIARTLSKLDPVSIIERR